jgi:hypothetical protein
VLASLLVVSGAQLVAAVSRTAELERSSGTGGQVTPDGDTDGGESGDPAPDRLVPSPNIPRPSPSIDIDFDIPTFPPIVPPTG